MLFILSFLYIFIINMNINQKVERKNSSYMLRNTTVTRLLKDMQLYMRPVCFLACCSGVGLGPFVLALTLALVSK